MTHLASLAVIGAVVLGGLPATASEQDVQAAVAVVLLKGVNPAQGNAPAAVQGTGFFISQDGYIVTSYHLLSKLTASGVDAETITYEIHPSTNSPISYRAIPLFTNPAADIMVLYAALGGQRVKTLRRTDRTRVSIVPAKTDIYSAGYPDGISFSYARGYIKSLGGPLEPIPSWTTNLTFKDGESGSPILLEDESVVAVVKGDDADATSIGIIVPSRLIPPEYWDAGPPETDAPSGRVRVEALTKASQPEYRQVAVQLSNGHCSPPQRRTTTVTARSGWSIDPVSVTLTPISSIGLNGTAVVDLAATDQIVVGAQLSNVGVCLMGGQVVADLSAQIQAILRFKEIPNAATVQWVTVSDVSLAKAVRAPLPKVPDKDLRYSLLDASGSAAAFSLEAGEVKTSKSGKSLDVGKIESRLAIERATALAPRN